MFARNELGWSPRMLVEFARDDLGWSQGQIQKLDGLIEIRYQIQIRYQNFSIRPVAFLGSNSNIRGSNAIFDGSNMTFDDQILHLISNFNLMPVQRILSK